MTSTAPSDPQLLPWWTNTVVYQIYPRSFQDSNGDGIGDLRGILQRVDYLAELGVGAVWLSPVYRSPQDDNGYDISDYQDIDPTFGTLEDLDALISAFHERGIRVIMDLVVNHTSDEHPWFIESRSSRDNPKRDWYWWRTGRPEPEQSAQGEKEPTNWGSFFQGSAWQWDEATGEYYLHLFSTKQPDLNWENPEVRGAVYEMMRWWLARGIDGFRMDVINVISKAVDADGSLPEGVPTDSGYGDGTPHFLNGPRMHEFLQEMHREVVAAHSGKLLLVGECLGASIDHARLLTDPSRCELDMVFTFEHMELDHGPGGRFDPKPFQLTELKATMSRWQDALFTTGWNALYLDNHDQPRLASRFGSDRFPRESAVALATVLHLHRGTPYVYQGEELGMTNPGFNTLDKWRDIESLNYAAAAFQAGVPDEAVLWSISEMGRDNARTPMQWDRGHQAGFTTGTPWIDVGPDYQAVNAEVERRDPGSVFHHYQKLIELRRRDRTVQLGDFTLLLAHHPRLHVFTRALDDDTLLVAANLSDEPDTLELGPSWDVGLGVVMATHPSPPTRANRVMLRPWEAIVARVLPSSLLPA